MILGGPFELQTLAEAFLKAVALTSPMTSAPLAPKPASAPLPAPIPPAPGGTSYWVQYVVATNCVATAYSGPKQPDPPGIATAGPFASQTAADAYAAALPCVQPGAGPGGAGQPGLGVAPGPLVPPAGTWYCFQSVDKNYWQVAELGGTLATTLMQGGYTAIGGPYQDQTTAEAACGALTTLPGAPPAPAPAPVAPMPAPPPPPPQPTPGWQCPIPAALAGGLPPPGSLEFCTTLDTISAWFSEAGNTLWEILDHALDAQYLQALLEQQPAAGSITNPLGYVQDLALYLLSKVAGLASPLLDFMRGVVDCARKWSALVFGRCNVQLITGLLSFRSVLESLDKIRGGWDIGAWITLDVRVYVEPLKEVVDYLVNWACPRELPHWGEAVEAWKLGLISDDYFNCLLRLNGQDPDVWMPFVQARGERLSPKEAIQYVRRNAGTPDIELATLRRLGFVDPVQAQAFQELYDELPTIGDHLEWLRKNVFDDHYVRDFQLLDGFGTVQDLADVGFPAYEVSSDTPPTANFWGRFGSDLRALGMKKKNAALHYAAHWLNPSFTQLFEMTQRLRPDKVGPELAFTDADLLRVMTELDVGVFFRRRLQTIAHPAINLTLATKLFGLRALDQAKFKSALQDLGYSLEDAELISSGIVPEVARLRSGYSHGWNPTAVGQAVALGYLTDQEGRDVLTPMGFSDGEIDSTYERALFAEAQRLIRVLRRQADTRALKAFTDAYVIGVSDQPTFVTQLQQMGGDVNTATKIAVSIDIGISNAQVKRRIALIGKSVAKGKLAVVEATTLLANMGIAQERIDDYVQGWQTTLEVNPPARTAEQILRWVAKGLMSADTAKTRLTNLGWQDADATLALAEVQGKIAAGQARLDAARQKTAAAAARAAAKVAADAQHQADAAKALVRKWSPPAALIRWYSLHLIDETQLRESLADMAMPHDDIERTVGEANVRRAAADERTTRKTKAPPPSGA